jgi:hypothetical protein
MVFTRLHDMRGPDGCPQHAVLQITPVDLLKLSNMFAKAASTGISQKWPRSAKRVDCPGGNHYTPGGNDPAL